MYLSSHDPLPFTHESLGTPHLPFPMWGRRWRHESRQQQNDWELHHVASSQLLWAPAKTGFFGHGNKFYLSLQNKEEALINLYMVKCSAKIGLRHLDTKDINLGFLSEDFRGNMSLVFHISWRFVTILKDLNLDKDLSFAMFGKSNEEHPEKKTQNITRYVLLTQLTPLK